ncbi:restriction endonuclease subunit S [Microbacterium sp. KKR3/1]|uniref:restriction endonuclease subunit S n=1 Tax=Microbacterium sp. KKR3/1 TaxID=2904241 RepID=UPI001E4821DD|nr:restriction endonuclease subunit S [Microbacterium sp. KKR3/1]MCE0508974.1 restriction endonuclease subunit S [Microbacterium sp. KKR3/1]
MDWTVTTLGDIGETLIGLTYSPSQVCTTGGTLVLRSSNIQGGQLALDDTVYVDAPIPEKIRVHRSDILICVRNGSRPLIGKSLVLDERVDGETFGAFMAVFRSPLNDYLRYFFQSEEFKRQVEEHLGATINQITNKSLKGFEVAYPGYRERSEIARRLADVDALVGALTQLIAKKRAIKQGMMQELLTGRTRLPGFTGDWSTARLGSALKVRNGRSQRDVEVAGGRYPILATGGEIGRTNTPIYTKPSVLIGRKGTIDRPRFQDSPFWTVDTLFYTEIDPRADARFLYYVCATIDWVSLSEATGVPSLTGTRIESVEILLPERREQQAIAAVVHDADSEIVALERRLESTRAIKQGMMQELLTGRTRLPVAEEVAA